MDRIELIPKDVRGGGNITQPHDNLISDENVSFYNSYLQRYNGSSDSFYLPYYRVISYSSNRELVWTPPRVIDDVDSVNVFVNLIFRDTGRSDAGCPVHLKLLDSDNEVLWSGDDYIGINGVTFTVPLPDNLPDVCYWRADLSHSGTVHMHDTRKMVVGSITDFDAFATEDIIQTGETSYLIGSVTGLSSEGNVFGVPGQLVNFYEVWTPGLRVSAPVVQSGDTVDIKAQLIDTVDGSLVRESGHVVNVYSVTDVPLVPTRLEFSVSKSILSYVDRDFAQMVVDVYDQFGNVLPGETIVFKVNGVVVDTQESKSYPSTHNYMSGGVGDVVLSVECGNLSESITIEDCTCYDTTEYNTQQSKDISLPSDFEIDVDLMATSSSDSYPQVYIGTELNTNHISFGQMSQQKQGVEFKKNNSRLTLLLTNGSQSVNNWYNVTLKKQGDDYTFLWGNETLSYTNSSISADKLFLIYLSNGKSRNLKIKPL